MRLSKHDIKKLPKRLQAQIGKQFSSNCSTKRQSINNAKALTNPKGKYCVYPSSSPAVTLFNELNRIYGSALYSGGDVAHEVLIDGSPKRWRYDHLIVSKRVLVEFNGWQYHSRKDAFQRDHYKRSFALGLGFIVFDVSNKMLRQDINGVMSTLAEVIKHRPNYNDVIEQTSLCYTTVYAAK